MAASHFKGYWSFSQNELPPQIKRESWGSLRKSILRKYTFLGVSSLRDPESRIARQKLIQIGRGDVSGRPKYVFLHFACLMCRFMHVLCADLCMCYVHCSPNGLAALRRARFARFASVQRPYIYIYIYIYMHGRCTDAKRAKRARRSAASPFVTAIHITQSKINT